MPVSVDPSKKSQEILNCKVREFLWDFSASLDRKEENCGEKTIGSNALSELTVGNFSPITGRQQKVTL